MEKGVLPGIVRGTRKENSLFEKVELTGFERPTRTTTITRG